MKLHQYGKWSLITSKFTSRYDEHHYGHIEMHNDIINNYCAIHGYYLSEIMCGHYHHGRLIKIL